jgi:hypothetical protein
VNADYDNDGKDDLLLAGIVQKGSPTMTLYHNDGNFSFHAAVTNLPAFVTGSAAWSDYDRDGDLDLAVNGRLSNQNYAFKILRNDGNGVFTDINSAVPPSGSLIAWGDYDGDGWPDITEPFPASFMGTRIYRNTGAGTFTNVSVSLPPLSRGVVSWADYDNDGLPDLLMAGYSTNSPLAQIYHNNGDGTFTNSSAVLPGVSDGLSAWGDFNNDNKLDVVLTGGLTRLHTNDSASLNTPPTPPAFPQATVTNSTVIFQWIAATDAQTPSALLTYNLRVGTSPGGQDVLAPNSDLTTGWRRIPATGNAGNGTNWHLNLAPGLYYWSVQAIDAGLAGSLFATENRFYVGPPCFLHIACPGANGLSIQGGAAGGTACLLQYSANLLNWTDYTNITVAANGLFDWRGAVPTGASSCFFRLHAP